LGNSKNMAQSLGKLTYSTPSYEGQPPTYYMCKPYSCSVVNSVDLSVRQYRKSSGFLGFSQSTSTDTPCSPTRPGIMGKDLRLSICGYMVSVFSWCEISSNHSWNDTRPSMISYDQNPSISPSVSTLSKQKVVYWNQREKVFQEGLVNFSPSPYYL